MLNVTFPKNTCMKITHAANQKTLACMLRCTLNVILVTFCSQPLPQPGLYLGFSCHCCEQIHPKVLITSS